MILLPLQHLGRYKHRERRVLYPHRFDVLVEIAFYSSITCPLLAKKLEIPTLDLFPDAIRPGPENIAPADAVILQHVCFEKNLIEISASIGQSVALETLHFDTMQKSPPLS